MKATLIDSHYNEWFTVKEYQLSEPFIHTDGRSFDTLKVGTGSNIFGLGKTVVEGYPGRVCLGEWISSVGSKDALKRLGIELEGHDV